MSTSGASCPRRDLPGVQPPRTRVSLLMSTSEASCPRRELPGVQPPRTCASLLMSTSGSELPKARTAWGATPAHVRWPLDEHERSELPWARIVPRGHAPRMDSGGTPPPGTGSAQHPQVLQQNLQAHQNQDNAAGQLGFALILGAEQAAHLHAHHGQREGDNPDKAHRRADVHA